VVLCEARLKSIPGQRVGLSLGGGGTGTQYCRDKRCITEQDRSVIQSNLIAYCSDDGIYLNRAATSKVLHNTLIDTGGIVVRFAESSADVQGNLVDGAIRKREGSILRATDNVETSLLSLFTGSHPVRDLYINPGQLQLQWKNSPPRVQSAAKVLDLCGQQRSTTPVVGAFENFAECASGPY
jgi:parallel beta-helix repeat protein